MEFKKGFLNPCLLCNSKLAKMFKCCSQILKPLFSNVILFISFKLSKFINMLTQTLADNSVCIEPNFVL